MHRLVPFFAFSYIFLSFALANDVERPLSLQDQCLELNIANLEEYISTLNLANVPTIDSMIIGFECPVTALPFGILRSDWARLLLLRNAQEKGSIFAEKLECLFKLLIIAYQRLEQSLIPKKSDTFDRTSNSIGNNTTKTKFTSTNFSPEIVPSGNTNINVIDDHRENINENKTNENGEKKDNAECLSEEFNKKTQENNAKNDTMENHNSENVALYTNLQRFTKADCFENMFRYSFCQQVNKLLINTDVMMEIANEATYSSQNEEITKVNIYNEMDNKKGITLPLTISTMVNSESGNVEVPMSTEKIASLASSTSTVKSNYARTSIEEFNSISSSSTVRTEIFEEVASQKTQTEIKNDGINVYNLINIYEENKSDGSFDSSTSTNFYSEMISPTDSEKFNTMDSVTVTKSVDINDSYAKNSVNDVTNRQDLQETISNELSILKNDNPTYASNVGTNSMDYFDPLWNSIYDVFTHKPDEFYSSIDRFHHKVGDKLKKLPVYRKQPSGHVRKDHKANVEVSSLLSKRKTPGKYWILFVLNVKMIVRKII
ncbi:glycosyltransferase-like protein gnt13 [Vespula squamosa]|uniref:Glycosyltransferase-like protein gnt13 n=1 Tax=Vespula squamosa TaxID=30214 RepID=A0ABD2A019_VESSQ